MSKVEIMNKENVNNGPTVVVKKINNIHEYGDIEAGTKKLLDIFKNAIKIPFNGTVMIKVNLCLLMGPETGATVEPKIALALVNWLKENYILKKIFIAEADATHLDAEVAYRALGWARLLGGIKEVNFLNLSTDDQKVISPRNATYLREIRMATTFLEADCLVSLAKLKTHTQQKITGIMKNQFGAISDKYKIVHHPRLAEAICDAAAVRLPDLCVIDGMVAMEGNGPTNGIPRIMKLLIGSNSALGIDHFCAKLMGFNPKSVPHLKIGLQRGMGTDKYRILGEIPEPLSQRFTFLPRWKEVAKKIIARPRKGIINEEA